MVNFSSIYSMPDAGLTTSSDGLLQRSIKTDLNWKITKY